MASVAIVGGTEDIRLLLRGLARLHQHRVVVEGGSPETLDAVAAAAGPLVLLVEVDLAEPSWTDRLGRLLRERPEVRGVLITPRSSARLEETARGLGIKAVLKRPFAVHQLVDLLTEPGVPAPTGPPGASSPTPT